jgi:DNA-binding transcriptional regulator YiaG
LIDEGDEPLSRAVLQPLTTGAGAFDQIRDMLDLSWPQLARLFGIRRHAFEQWRARGQAVEPRPAG